MSFAILCRNSQKRWLRLLDYGPDSLRVMLVALDRHLKQRDSKMPIAKDRELVKCKQEHFAKKATENDQMQQKHLPFKTRPKEMQNIKQWPVLSCHY